MAFLLLPQVPGYWIVVSPAVEYYLVEYAAFAVCELVVVHCMTCQCLSLMWYHAQTDMHDKLLLACKMHLLSHCKSREAGGHTSVSAV